MRLTILSTLALLGVAWAPDSPADAAPGTTYDNVVVFGDSLSDVGNVYLLSGNTIPGAPYYDGRYSNGLLWVEHIAGSYGVVLTPSGSGPSSFGNDWAYAGAATTVDVSADGVTIPSLKHQQKAYLLSTSGVADPQTLYVIWGGGNDVQYSLLGENGVVSPASLPAVYANKTAAMIRALKAAGARSFIVVSVPDVGLTPDVTAIGEPASKAATSLSKAMNAALLAALADPTLAAGIQIDYINTLKIMDEIILGNTNFAFTDVVDACVSGTSVCPQGNVTSDPAHTFFWDGFHPSSFAHAMIAVEAMKALALH